MDYKNKSVLITGGTGSLGVALTKYFLNNHPEISRLIVYSRDEQKQFLMSDQFPYSTYPQMRYFIGDIRDKSRLQRALNDVDYVIHTAAMKHVHIAEYNPDECVKTNIGGAQNLIEACLSPESNVSHVVALSTDKACAPINLYGATKLTSDKMFVSANNFSGKKNIKFSVVRYGNVFGSNGSVVPFFLKKKSSGVLPITNENMTRFNISLQDGVKMVLHALENAWGGELFVPKIPSYNILDMANAICSSSVKKVIGTRPGEKIHEEMITSSDSYNTFDIGEFYVILPTNPNWSLENYISEFNARKVKEGFSYNSGSNNEWETIKTLKTYINKYIEKQI